MHNSTLKQVERIILSQRPLTPEGSWQCHQEKIEQAYRHEQEDAERKSWLLRLGVYHDVALRIAEFLVESAAKKESNPLIDLYDIKKKLDKNTWSLDEQNNLATKVMKDEDLVENLQYIIEELARVHAEPKKAYIGVPPKIDNGDNTYTISAPLEVMEAIWENRRVGIYHPPMAAAR